MKFKLLRKRCLALLILAAVMVLAGCGTPEEPTGTTVSWGGSSDITAENAGAADELLDTDRPVLIHLADIRGDLVRMERAAQFADHVKADAMLVSGGLTDPSGTGSAILEASGKFPQVPALYSLGEGDTVPGVEPYSFADLASAQLRILCVDQSTLGQEQLDWIVETLAGTPEGYGVILMYHTPETRLTVDPEYPDFFQGDTVDPAPLQYAGTILGDIVDSFMMEKRFLCEYSDSDGTPVTVDADFTALAGDVEFIAHVTGSLHADTVTSLPGTACRQLLLGVTCSAALCEEACPSGLDREEGSGSQDAFNAYIINRKKKTLRILRIGAGITASGEVRDEMTIPYSAPHTPTELPFDTEHLTQLDLSGVTWSNWGMDASGATENCLPGLRFTADQVFTVPYEGVTFYIGINAPFELELRSGPTADSLETVQGWLSSKPAGDLGSACTIPAGHQYFAISVANVTRLGTVLDDAPISTLELELADVALWYDPCDHRWDTTVISPGCTEWGSSTAICSVCGREDTEAVVTDISGRFQWTQSMSINTINGKTFADDKWALSDYVDISGYDSLEVTVSNDNSTGTTSGLVFFNGEKKRISGGVINSDGSGAYGVSVRYVEIPDNAVYVRTIWFSEMNSGYDSQWGGFSCKATGPKSLIPPAGHSYEALVTPPTCTSVGYTTHTCSVCSDSYRDSELPMAHNYTAGVCTGCGASRLGSEWLAPDFAEGDYTMLVLPDTQCMVEHWPEYFQDMTQWIADNKERLNIQAVLHLGDMVDDNLAVQWSAVKEGMDRINAAGIPWMPMRGNHDDSEYFNRYFDYSTYGSGQSWFGGSYEEGKLDNTYWFVTVGQREYLILSLGWAPSWDVLDWAKGIVEAHPQKNVIITAHGYMNKNGQLLSEISSISITKYFKGYPEGYQVWEAFQGYENVVLAMGGHVPSPDVIQWVGKNGAGRDVSSLLFDRQTDDIENHYGMIGVLTFHADSDTVDINWYSADLDALYREENQFSIEVPHIE